MMLFQALVVTSRRRPEAAVSAMIPVTCPIYSSEPVIGSASALSLQSLRACTRALPAIGVSGFAVMCHQFALPCVGVAYDRLEVSVVHNPIELLGDAAAIRH